MHSGDRIKRERERLNYNQTDFAAVAGTTRKTLFNWESGIGGPNPEALGALAAIGLDVLYVVMGQLSPGQTAAPAGLSRRASALVANYEATDEAGKRLIEGTANLAAQPSIARQAGSR
jgi:transcriptional regulator with XRE-family HTH domain